MKNVNIGIIISNRCYNHESNRTNQIYIYIHEIACHLLYAIWV